VNGELDRSDPPHARPRRGDGEHTVAQLVEIVNQDPRRGVGHEKVLTRLEIDAQAQMMLTRAELTRGSVPGRERASICARPQTSRLAARQPTSPT
jgi:cyanophycin synthetase